MPFSPSPNTARAGTYGYGQAAAGKCFIGLLLGRLSGTRGRIRCRASKHGDAGRHGEGACGLGALG